MEGMLQWEEVCQLGGESQTSRRTVWRSDLGWPEKKRGHLLNPYASLACRGRSFITATGVSRVQPSDIPVGSEPETSCLRGEVVREERLICQKFRRRNKEDPFSASTSLLDLPRA